MSLLDFFQFHSIYLSIGCVIHMIRWINKTENQTAFATNNKTCAHFHTFCIYNEYKNEKWNENRNKNKGEQQHQTFRILDTAIQKE